MVRGSGRRDSWEDRLRVLGAWTLACKKWATLESFKQGCNINTLGLQKQGEWRKDKETRVTEIG